MTLLCLQSYMLNAYFVNNGFQFLLQLMKQIPNVNVLDLQKLDERMLKESQKGNKVEKAKKEMFKKITSPVSILRPYSYFSL